MTALRQTSLFIFGLLAVATAQTNEIERKKETPVYFMNIPADTVTLPAQAEAGEGEPGRIVGGTSVQPGELPFFGHFEGDVMCGGFLTEPDIFVTAAHCLEKGFPGTIRIGATTTVSSTEGQSVPVCSAMIHPANNMKSMQNDIAILKLCDPVQISAYGEYNRDPGYPSATGTDVFMLGFGRTEVFGNLSPILQIAKVDYLDNGACAARYEKYNGEQTFCADSPTSGICYGDSGGPALDSTNLVVGLNSYIVDTCASGYPDFFTRISTYSDWLDARICEQALTTPEWCAGISATGGTGTQGDDDEAADDDAATDDITGIIAALQECLTLVAGLLTSLLGGD